MTPAAPGALLFLLFVLFNGLLRTLTRRSTAKTAGTARGWGNAKMFCRYREGTTSSPELAGMVGGYPMGQFAAPIWCAAY